MLVIVLQKYEFSMNSRLYTFLFVRSPDQVFNLECAIQDREAGVQFGQHLSVPRSDHTVDNATETCLLAKCRGLYLLRGAFHRLNLRIQKETRQPYGRNHEDIDRFDVKG